MKVLKYFLFASVVCMIIFRCMHIPTPLDTAIGQLPVLHDGRVKPIDTLARHYLLNTQGKQS